MFRTKFSLVRSVPMHSMKTFFVSRVIAESEPLIMGGKYNTILHHVTTFTKGNVHTSKKNLQTIDFNEYKNRFNSHN